MSLSSFRLLLIIMVAWSFHVFPVQIHSSHCMTTGHSAGSEAALLRPWLLDQILQHHDPEAMAVWNHLTFQANLTSTHHVISCHLIKSIQIRTLLHYGNGIDECWSRWRFAAENHQVIQEDQQPQKDFPQATAKEEGCEPKQGPVEGQGAKQSGTPRRKPNATCPTCKTCKKSKAKEDFLWSCHISLSFTHVDSLVTISQSAEANPALPKARVSMHVCSNFQCYSYSNICHQLIQSWLLCFLASRGEHGHSAPKI